MSASPESRTKLRNTSGILLLCLCVPLSSAAPASATREIELLARELVTSLQKGDYAAATKHFDETMKRAPAEKLREVWTSLQAQVGKFQRQGAVRTERIGAYDAVFVRCEFQNAALDAKVVFDAKRRVAGLFFVPAATAGASAEKPPPYGQAKTYREKEVTVGEGDWTLPGTLTFPLGEGPFPAVVLVHGSGPNDRDETVGAAKPFRDLAWGLAAKGIAALRYEKRTKIHGAKMNALMERVTVQDETVEDVLAAVTLLRRTASIDTSKIFVLGHSLGGQLVPRIAKQDPGIEGFIILAGSTRPLEEVIVEQMEYIFSLDGTTTGEEKAELERIRGQARLVQSPDLSLSSKERPFGVPAAYWLDLRGYKPAEAAREVTQRLLILQGERDYQVTMSDFEGWRKALSDKKNVELKTYPKVNHLFIEGEGRSSPAEYEKVGHVAPYVIEDIAVWIRRPTSPVTAPSKVSTKVRRSP